MMYSNKFVAAIKVNGKTLREENSVVKLPFLSEYSIYLKNLENRRAKVQILIDGKDITRHIKLVLGPKQEIDLERFLSNDRKFKFIKLTEEIESYRGITAEDGLIEINFSFESVGYFRNESIFNNVSPRPPFQPPIFRHPYSQFSCSVRNRPATLQSKSISINSVSDEGITAEGSKSDQEFSSASYFKTDGIENTIIFKLSGSKKVKTTKEKKTCPSCGKKYKNKFEFCPSDGTYLR